MKSKIPQEWVTEWKKLEDKLRSAGLSKWGTYQEIAELYNVSSSTVFAYLTDGYLEKRRKRNRRNVRRYQQRIDVKAKKRIYSRKYIAMRRHIGDRLLQVLGKHEEAALEEILSRIAGLEGIRMETDTLRRCLQGCEEEYGFAPIVETCRSGHYRLNKRFYSTREQADTYGG